MDRLTWVGRSQPPTTALISFVQSLFALTTQDAMAARTMEVLQRLFACDLCGVVVVDGQVLAAYSLDCAGVHRVVNPPGGDRFHGHIASLGQSIRLADASREPLAGSWSPNHPHVGPFMSAPLWCTCHALGVLVVGNHPSGHEFTTGEEQTLVLMACLAGVALGTLQRQARAAEAARLIERRRIADSLHESLAQSLFLIGLEARRYHTHAGLDDATRNGLGRIGRLAARGSDEVRGAIFALRSAYLPEGTGLTDLLQDQVATFEREAQLSAALLVAPDLADMPLDVGEATVRIVQEALSNVRKHARASHVMVSLGLEATGDALLVTVMDNGVGLNPSVFATTGDAGLHFGLAAMHSLAERLGGSFSLGPGDGGGTMVRARLPLPPAVS